MTLEQILNIDLIECAERGLLPDSLIRLGIRRLLKRRLSSLPQSNRSGLIHELRESPLAIDTELANRQHYEVPTEFFHRVLGPRLKYSACLFSCPSSSLADAEEAMLAVTCERAEIEDGMQVLELGCGWGSLTLWMAERYPACRVTAVSNSTTQQSYIESLARQRGLRNITVLRSDMREFEPPEQYDRIVSVEMFEHMRNYELLFRRTAKWLHPSGKMFVHIFCHRSDPYLFETDGKDDWMSRHFFTGGTMPSENLFAEFDDAMAIQKQWRVNGNHYWRTCEAWLRNLDRQRPEIVARFRRDLPASEARRVVQRWRIFFMACAELFRYRGGSEWFVTHYLFQPAGRTTQCLDAVSTVNY